MLVLMMVGVFAAAARAFQQTSRPAYYARTTRTLVRASTASETPASATFAGARTKVKDVVEADAPLELVGSQLVVKGWVRTVRAQKKLGFLEVNDGSSLKGLQCVVEGEELLGELASASTGCAVSVTGTVVEGGGKQQVIELKTESLKIVGECDSSFPLQKKRHSMEFLRTIAHLRPRTNTIGAVARVRSRLAQATHEFFQTQGFQYLHSPVITASDCEGAGEMFGLKDEEFFGKPTFLTVSGQLSAEAYACALGDVYTFGPTFRAENSQTTRHLAEFWMIEPEMAFSDIVDAQANAEALLKHVVGVILRDCRVDLEFLDKFFGDSKLIDRLEKLVQVPFIRMSYTEAVEKLQAVIAEDPSKWQFPTVEFGTDLATEHERYLAETAGTCVFVYDYPKEIKAFYMRDNDDEPQTVAAFDLLAPGVGELVGGSQREERVERLSDKIVEAGLDLEEYWWYLDLRKYGSVPHAGYGLGFDRLVCYVTAQENIREVAAFPRYPGHATF